MESAVKTCIDKIPVVDCIRYLARNGYQCTRLTAQEQFLCQKTCHLCNSIPEIQDHIVIEKPVGGVRLQPVLSENTNFTTNPDINSNLDNNIFPAWTNEPNEIALWLVIVVIVAIVVFFCVIGYITYKCHVLIMRNRHKREIRTLHHEFVRQAAADKEHNQVQLQEQIAVIQDEQCAVEQQRLDIQEMEMEIRTEVAKSETAFGGFTKVGGLEVGSLKSKNLLTQQTSLAPTEASNMSDFLSDWKKTIKGQQLSLELKGGVKSIVIHEKTLCACNFSV